MIFTKTITIQVLNNAMPVCGLVCSVELLMHHKNDYSIGFFKTNDKGEFVISKEKIEMKIKEANQLFLMDYDSSAKNFKGCIKIVIETSENIKNKMNSIKEFFPESYAKIKPILLDNTNEILISPFSNVFQIKKNIKINIEHSLV